MTARGSRGRRWLVRRLVRWRGAVGARLVAFGVACALLGAVWCGAPVAAGAAPPGDRGPIDAIRIDPPQRGRLELSAALELAPSGWEAWIPASDGPVAYAEAIHHVTGSVGARYTVAPGWSVAVGARAGVTHQREVWDGGGESRWRKTALKVTTASVQFDAPRWPRGTGMSVALRAAPRSLGVELSVSQIRDPLVLFGSLHVNREAVGSERVGSVGLGVGAAFVANERVTLRTAVGLTSPLAGVRAPASALSWRMGYLLDAQGDQEIAAFGSWTQQGQELAAKIGVEWKVAIVPSSKIATR